MNNKARIPRTQANDSELFKFQQRTARSFANVINLGDAVAEAQKRLLLAGRITKESQANHDISVQLVTLEMIANECLHIPPPLIDEIRAKRNTEQYEKNINAIMDRIAPRIIIPAG